MTIISYFMPELPRGTIGNASGLTLILTKASDRSILNGVGDSLLWAANGWFTADVAEPWAELLAATVVDGDGLIPRAGWLGAGSTIVVDSLVELSSSGTSAITTPILSAIDDIEAGSGPEGPGDDWVTIKIEDDGVPEPDVSVWLTSDAPGVTVIAGTLTTNSLGVVRFLLTEGATYYLWAKKVGKISIEGREFIAEAD